MFAAVLEICARVDDWIKWKASPFKNYSRDSLSLVDQYGFRNRPNAKYEKWKINKFGFRGPDFSMKKPDGIERIMILGASETFGLYEQANLEYPAQLQRLLDQEQSDRFQIINAAVPGISPPRLIHLYKTWLHRFKPDIIYYYPSPSIYLLKNPPGPVLPGFTTNSEDQPVQLRILGKTRIIIKRFLPDNIQTIMKRYLISKAIASIPDESIFQTAPLERLDLFRDQLSELVRTVKSNGTEVVLITHANRVSIPVSEEEWQILTGWRKLYPHVAEKCFLEMESAGNRIIKQVTEQFGIRLVDADAKLPKTEKYFADHIHFTTEGAGRMANLLAEDVLSNPH